MTNTVSLAAIAAEIETLRADLRTVNAAADIIGDAAHDRAKAIEAAVTEAQARYADALAAEAEKSREARLADFRSIRVETTYPAGADGNLLRAGFVIHYERMTYDARYRAAFPVAHSCNGFSALPNEVYEYLVVRHPEAIPAEIMALHPDDPQEAFRAYFMGKRRGVIRSPSRVDGWASAPVALS